MSVGKTLTFYLQLQGSFMLRKVIFGFLVLIGASGCSQKYIGMDGADLTDNFCSIEMAQCRYDTGDFKINYTLEQVQDTEYKMSGKVLWSNSGALSIYDNIDFMRLTFIFLDDKKVIHEEDIYFRGPRDKEHDFELNISSTSKIKNSAPIKYRYRITE